MGLEALPARAGFLRCKTNVAHMCARMHVQTHTHACTQTRVCTDTQVHMHTHNVQLSHVRACAHIHVHMCSKGDRTAPCSESRTEHSHLCSQSPGLRRDKLLPGREAQQTRRGEPRRQEGPHRAGPPQAQRDGRGEPTPSPRAPWPGLRFLGIPWFLSAGASGPSGPWSREGLPRQQTATSGPSPWHRAGRGESAWGSLGKCGPNLLVLWNKRC